MDQVTHALMMQVGVRLPEDRNPRPIEIPGLLRLTEKSTYLDEMHTPMRGTVAVKQIVHDCGKNRSVKRTELGVGGGRGVAGWELK